MLFCVVCCLVLPCTVLCCVLSCLAVSCCVLLCCAACRASLVGGEDGPLDPQYLEDWGTRGLAMDDCGVEDKVRRAGETRGGGGCCADKS